MAAKKGLKSITGKLETIEAFEEEIDIDFIFDDFPNLVKECSVVLEAYYISLWQSFYLAEAAGKVFMDMLSSSLPQSKIGEVVKYLSVPSEKAHVAKIADYLRQEKDSGKRVEYVKENFPWLGNSDPLIAPLNDEQIQGYIKALDVEVEVGVNDKAFEEVDQAIVKKYQDTVPLS